MKKRLQKEDLTGRDRMVTNVLWSWGGYLVVIAAGFIMPRLIDHHLGQLSLGIWDFCWSIVSYLGFSGLGIGSSVNRYVAKYRASNNIDSLCKAVSSVLYIQLAIATFVVLLTAALTWYLPCYFSNRLGNEIRTAQWVVASLGLSVAFQMAVDTSRGVITGCHRWDIHNGIDAIYNAIILAGMVTALLLGKGLRTLGLAYLCSTIIVESLRLLMAYRICPELKIRLSLISWCVAKEMILFGWKTVVASLFPLIIVQTTNIFLVGALGPAALAVFSRPMALVRHVETILNKFAFITTPTAGALQEGGKKAELNRFLLDTARYGVAIVFPITIFLILFSDIILTIWMGPKYANGWVLTIFAIGYFLPTSQSSVMKILMGMNLHGRIGLVSLLVSLITFSFGTIVINAVGWSLVHGALLIVIPLTLGNGIIVPIYACRQFQIPIMKYIRHIFVAPFVCAIALGLILFLGRILFPDNVFISVCFGLSVGGLFTCGFYWRYIFTESIRTKISHIIYRTLP